MSTWSGWLPLLGQLTALSAVVALSPFTVIPALALIMHSERPRIVGLTFIAGWLVGKAAITVAFLRIPQVTHSFHGPPWTAWLRIAIGLLVLGAAVAYWRRPPSTAGAPRWLDRIKRITPVGAAVTGVALTVINVKVVLACAAAGYLIGTHGLSLAATCVAVAYFTLVAGSTAVLPILAYAVWTHRIDRQLEGFKRWLQRRQRVITVILLVLIGVGLIYSGVQAV
jgi:Sap, sulfolipid-1-addressing protein